MVTIKEIESDREEYILGYNTCKEDIIKLIDKWINESEIIEDYNLIEVQMAELIARING